MKDVDLIRNWLVSICAVSLLASVLGAITPESGTKNALKLCCALLLTIAVIAPFKKIDFDFLTESYETMSAELDEKKIKITEENEKIKDDIIAQTLCEYICKRGELAENEIEINCENGEIKSVLLYKKSKDIIKIVEEECGIEKDKIIIKAEKG